MQIGMVGSDGVILASDTRATHFPAKLKDGQVGRGVRYGTHCSKIQTGKEIAVSFAQDMEIGNVVSTALVGSFTANAPQEAIERIVASIPEDKLYPVQGLIAVPPFELFRFQIAKEDGAWIAYCHPSAGLDAAGDIANAAIYWVERYYDPTYSIEQLLPLAAYMISCSHHLNTAGVGGLEIVMCDATGIHPVKRERILALLQDGKELDRKISTAIFGSGVSQ